MQDLGAHFPGFRAAFVLRDVTGGRTVRHDPARAGTRTGPCSTFKIPNSLIGLETGVIKDASYVLKWDGVRRPREEWNRDHDLRSAMRYSVVWYYQELARRVGPGADAEVGVGLPLRQRGHLRRDRPLLAGLVAADLARRAGRLPGSSPGRRAARVGPGARDREGDPRPGPAGPGDRLPGQDRLLPGPGRPGAARVVGGVGREEGRRFVFAATIAGPGASGMVCRPMAERALAALGVLPARRRGE